MAWTAGSLAQTGLCSRPAPSWPGLMGLRNKVFFYTAGFPFFKMKLWFEGVTTKKRCL